MDGDRWNWRLALLLVVLWPASASATVVIHVGLDELTEISHVIAHVDVESVEFVQPRPGVIKTRPTFRAREILRGAEDFDGELLVVEVGGGEWGDLRSHIPGMPRFRAGQEVLLFLERTSGGHIFTGLGQGVFRLRRDPASGEALATRRLNGVGLVDRDATGASAIRHSSAPVVDHPLHHLMSIISSHLEDLGSDGGAR